MMEKEIKKILFLSYLTGYNITEVYSGFRAENFSAYIDDHIRNRQTGGSELRRVDVEATWRMASERYEEMRYYGIRFIPFFSKEYPPALKDIHNPPPLLYCKGIFHERKNIAVVGSRNTSGFAASAVDRVVRIFAEHNYGIVSGLAFGIDILAHQAALRQKAYTIAVLPNALDYIYPKEHLKYGNEILDSGGALISELPLKLNLGKKGFVQRNRLQTALSEFVMPIEMGISSGTMHTIQFCIRQKKKLLLVQPNEEKSKLKEYEGIMHLIDKNSYDKLTILKEDFTWNDIFTSSNKIIEQKNDNQILNVLYLSNVEENKSKLDLFKSFVRKYEELYKGMWLELNDLEKTKDNKEFQALKNSLSRQFKSDFQILVIKFLEEHPKLTKDIEKFVKEHQKEINSI